MSRALRDLPSVHAILSDPRVAGLPHDLLVSLARAALERARAALRDGGAAIPDVAGAVAADAARLLDGRLRRVINATGVVIHTNLGRAPWAPEAVAAAARAAGYTPVELDLSTGARGGRGEGVDALLRHLTGAEASLVVNNCAAAVLLALTALARGRDVIVSRGELVEIGGSFRVPDVIASGGARLVEVGTTNRTRASDFAAALGPDAAVLLRVHPSNFRIVGFTESADRDALVALAAERGLHVVEDLGSGSLDGDRGEPSVRAAVAAGVDVVVFSGDKLLGGPQAGLLVGRRDAIARLAAHPMQRALRVDKVTLAALEATLALHVRGVRTPVQEMLATADGVLAERAARLRGALEGLGVRAEVRADTSETGGGAHAGLGLPTWVVAVPGGAALAARLRAGDPSVVARVADDALLLDLRTLRPDELDEVAAQVAAVRDER